MWWLSTTLDVFVQSCTQKFLIRMDKFPGHFRIKVRSLLLAGVLAGKKMFFDDFIRNLNI
jgi:hypothetical protein